MEESKIIARIGTGENGEEAMKEPIFISLSEFKGSKFINVRKYYQDNEEWKPTKKGITFNLKQLSQIMKAFNDNATDIESWFK